jgi:transcriptional regulator with XRE-family HTH domain
MANTDAATVVRNLREIRDISRRELARRAECSDMTVKRIEEGAQPSVDLMRRLLDALNADSETRLALLS